MYENQKCSYCSKVFVKDDDIVVCPECGAPYHRQCWEEHGKCAFDDRHKEGFTYSENKDGKPFEDAVQPTEDFIAEIEEEIHKNTKDKGIIEVKNTDKKSEKHCEQCGAKLIDGSNYCVYCGHKAGEPVYEGGRKNYSGEDPLGGVQPDDTILGVKASDIALIVRNGSAKFIPRFKKAESRKSKITWSWPAFFFGYLYMFFRKLYKYGIIFILAQVLAFNVINAAMGDPVGNLEKKVSDIYNSYTSSISGSDAQSMSETEYNKMMSELRARLTDDSVMIKAYIAIGAGLFLTNIVCALYFNYFYLRRCADTIKKMKESADMLGGMSEQEYKFNLMARGGISLFGLFLGYFLKMMTEYLLSYILSLFV